MATSVRDRIQHAAAVLCGPRGSVSAQARKDRCSRQTVYDHAAQVRAAVSQQSPRGPSHDECLQTIAELRREVAELRCRLAHALVLDKPRRKRLTAEAAAMGLSTGQITELFRLLLTDQPEGTSTRAPSRATVGRWVRAAAVRASKVLRVLDAVTQQRPRVLCVDELFFHGCPVLIGVDPLSLTVGLCQRAKDRTAQTWVAAVRPFAHLELAVADAGTGVQAGLKDLSEERAAGRDPSLTVGLDVFHTEREARKLLAGLWRRCEKAWRSAEALEARALEPPRRRKRPRQRGTRGRNTVKKAWRHVGQALADYDQYEAAWRRAKAALGRFRPDGRLNDRASAQSEIRAACKKMPHKRWAHLRSLLQDERTLAFLDRMHHQLADAAPRPELREALAELWRLERTGGRGAEILAVVQCRICACLSPNWRTAYARVSAVLAEAVAASSAVECVNAVLRMHQSRHRSVTQELLDLKRL